MRVGVDKQRAQLLGDLVLASALSVPRVACVGKVEPPVATHA